MIIKLSWKYFFLDLTKHKIPIRVIFGDFFFNNCTFFRSGSERGKELQESDLSMKYINKKCGLKSCDSQIGRNLTIYSEEASELLQKEAQTPMCIHAIHVPKTLE